MKYKFGDIIYNITEKRKPTEEDRLNYIGLEHLDSGSLFVTRWGAERAPEGEKIVMKKGDVLFGKRRAYQKKVAISPIDGVFSAHGMVLRPKEDVICKEFLPFFISSDYFLNEAIRISVGGLSPTINWKDIKELEFNLPSIDEQKVLAEKLWAAYEVKQSYLKMIDATDEMVKSQFIEMFGNQDNNNLGWELAKIKDEFELTMGKTPARNNPQYWEPKDFKWISISDMATYERYTEDTEEKISQLAVKESGIKVIPEGTLIMSFKLSIGRTAITSEDIYSNEAIMAFKNFDSSRLNIDFLHFLFSNKNWLLGAKLAVKGHTMNKETIGESTIIVPPLTLQEQFANIYNQADKSKAELRKSIDAIDKVIKSLINENL